MLSNIDTIADYNPETARIFMSSLRRLHTIAGHLGHSDQKSLVTITVTMLKMLDRWVNTIGGRNSISLAVNANDVRRRKKLEAMAEKLHAILNQDNIPDERKIAEWIASNIRFADCGELAMLSLFAFQQTRSPWPVALFSVDISIGDSMTRNVYHHNFLVVALRKFKDIKEQQKFFACPDLWPGQAVIFDPWSRMICVTREEMEKLPIYGYRSHNEIANHDVTLSSTFVCDNQGECLTAEKLNNLQGHGVDIRAYSSGWYDPNTGITNYHDVSSIEPLQRVELAKESKAKSVPLPHIDPREIDSHIRTLRPRLVQLLRNPFDNLIISVDKPHFKPKR